MMDNLPAKFIWPTVNTNFICRRCLIWEWSFYAIHSPWHWYQLGVWIIQPDGITGNVYDLSAPGWCTVQWSVHTFFVIVLPPHVLEHHTYLTVVNGFSFTLLYKGLFTKWILQHKCRMSIFRLTPNVICSMQISNQWRGTLEVCPHTPPQHLPRWRWCYGNGRKSNLKIKKVSWNHLLFSGFNIQHIHYLL